MKYKEDQSLSNDKQRQSQGSGGSRCIWYINNGNNRSKKILSKSHMKNNMNN